MTPTAKRPLRVTRSSSTVRVALTQMACGSDPKANLARQVRLLERAAKGGAKILCTQELFASQYFCQAEDHRFFKLAETIPGPSTDALAKLAKKHRAVIVGEPVRAPRRGAVPQHRGRDRRRRLAARASTARCTSRTIRSTTRSSTSRPATRAFARGRPQHATIGVLICWDQWFPEGARLTAMQGAEILFYPTAIGWHPSEKKEYGERAARVVGDSSSARTPSPTAATCARPTASGTNRSWARTASR